MKVEVKDNEIRLSELANGIALVSQGKEEIALCARDGGFEFSYGSILYQARNGKITEIGKKKSNLPDGPTLATELPEDFYNKSGLPNEKLWVPTEIASLIYALAVAFNAGQKSFEETYWAGAGHSFKTWLASKEGHETLEKYSK